VIGVHLGPVPTGVGDHHGGDPPDDGVVVGRHVNGEQLVEGGGGVVGVDAAGGAAVADVVLGARRHVPPPGDERRALAAAGRDLALEPRDDGGHAPHELGVLAEALVAPAPSRVPADLHAQMTDSDSRIRNSELAHLFLLQICCELMHLSFRSGSHILVPLKLV
jgi:hypothetical protein